MADLAVNWQMAYVVLSGVIAIAIWLQNALLKKNQGKLPKQSMFYLLSTLDTLWVIVSAVAVYWMSFYSIVMSIPVVYMIYTISGWFYAAHTMKDVPTSAEDIVFEKNYLDFCQSFALAFFILCMIVLYAMIVGLPFLMVSE